MSKFKRMLSFLLTIVMLVTAFTSTRMIANATTIPLQEVNAYLVLKNYSDAQIKAMPLSAVLSLLQDSEGNYIEIADDAEVVWSYFKDNEGNIIQDEYHVISRDTTVDLTYFKETTGYTMELIVGSGNQLDAGNVRYIVKVYFTGYNNTISFDLYSQSEDGSTRTKIEPTKKLITDSTYDKIVDINGNPVPMLNFAYTVPAGDYGGLHLGMKASIDDRPDVDVEVYEITDNTLQNPITDKILNPDMSVKDAGYVMTDTAAGFILVYYIDGVQLDMGLVMFMLTGTYVHVSGDLYNIEGGVKSSAVYKENEDINLNSDVYTFEYELNKECSVDGEYYLNFEALNGTVDLSGRVTKAVVGHYDTLDAATAQTDIKEQLFSSNSGYKANYSGEGVDFTLFFEDGVIDGTNVYKLTVKTVEFNDIMPAFDDAPIVGAKDPYFRVDGVKSGSSILDTYIVENGKNINMDTMYGYGYQTILINDKNVDLSNLKPTFWYGDADRVDTYVGSKQESGVSVQDFSNGAVQYGTIIDENVKNYQVTFVKKETGAKLFVNGPSTRTIFLDEYFEYKHDILIANVGDKPLTGLKVTLDATNVKLDDYWTVGGTNNDTLAAFTTTEDTSSYGELANIAKIRLLPDGDGEVEGTLTISADGQKDVVINLTGRAANPTIITKELDDAVKYVPYSYLVSTDNMNDWNSVTFSIESGELPEGLELFPTTGEIYGVPQESGTFTIRVKATYGRSDYFEPSYADLTLVVKDNTNENVYLASDEGYGIKQSIGTETTNQYEFVLENIEDTVFTSYGEYDQFVDLWLNGVKLVEGVDYTKEEGSTKITIKSQTFENKTNTNESNTIAMEFRNEDNELNRTSQNFITKTETNVDKVIAKIAALPSNITLSDKSAVQSARSAYNALTSSEKTQVTNYSKLTAAENKIEQLEEAAANQAAADKVIAKINAIPSTITADSKDEIQAARTAYNALTSAQKNLVTNYNRLTTAETALKQYEEQQADKAAANKVITLISAIPASITTDAKDEIDAARTAYNALTSEQKAYVTNYDRLTSAETALKQYEEQQAQIAADKAAANKVVNLIDALPANVTLSNRNDVNNARIAYNSLTAAQKGYVTNYTKLTDAEDKIVELDAEAQEQAKINSVITAIDAIPEQLTLNDKAAVEAAREAYDALTTAQKAKVINYNDLTNAENTIVALEAQENANKADKAAANEVINLIDTIPEEVKLTDKATVQAIRESYDKLTDNQKKLVTNYSDLTDAEVAIKALEDYEAATKKDQAAADEVINLINAIPSEVTLDDKVAVETARTAYDALTDNQKKIVTNYDTLTDAEVKIAELENKDYEEVQSITFVGILVDKDGKALADKVVEIHSVIQTGRTDENGSFQFNNVEFGNHTVFVKDENGNITAQKEFNIVLGSPLALNGNEIVAENGSVFTVKIQLDGDELTFMNVEDGNKAPVVDTDKSDEDTGIDIGDDKTPDTDKGDDGIYIGDGDKVDTIPDTDVNTGNDQGNVSSPQTGDNSNLALWYTLLVASLGGLIVTTYSGLRKRKYVGKYQR